MAERQAKPLLLSPKDRGRLCTATSFCNHSLFTALQVKDSALVGPFFSKYHHGKIIALPDPL